MNPILFAFISGIIMLLLVEYKGRTAIKAHTRFKKAIDEINELDTNIKPLLKDIVFEGIKPLLFVKSITGLFYYKKAKKIIDQYSDTDKQLFERYSLEMIKIYLTYAPHWILFIAPLVVLIALFAVMFSTIDKLKNILKPIQNRLIVH